MELLRIANYKELQEWEKRVTLLIDEMHLKEDLVYVKGQVLWLASHPLVKSMTS